MIFRLYTLKSSDEVKIYFTLSEPCIVINICEKDQQNAHFS